MFEGRTILGLRPKQYLATAKLATVPQCIC